MAQDRIFFKNGSVINATINEVNDSVVLTNSSEFPVIETNNLYFIQYALGDFMPFSGAMARRYRAKAHQYYPNVPMNSIGVGIALGFVDLKFFSEHFLNKQKYRAFTSHVKLGLIERGSSLRPQRIQVELGLAYAYYPSLQRKTRYFLGPEIRIGKVAIYDYSAASNERRINSKAYGILSFRQGITQQLSKALQLQLATSIGLCPGNSLDPYPLAFRKSDILEPIQLEFSVGLAYKFYKK